LLLALDGHILMIEALAHSMDVIGIGAAVDWQAGTRMLVRYISDLFLTGVRIAAPVTLAVLISNLALGILAKATPKLNSFMLAYPLQIAIGLITVGIALPLVFAVFAGWDGMYREIVVELLGGM